MTMPSAMANIWSFLVGIRVNDPVNSQKTRRSKRLFASPAGFNNWMDMSTKIEDTFPFFWMMGQ